MKFALAKVLRHWHPLSYYFEKRLVRSHCVRRSSRKSASKEDDGSYCEADCTYGILLSVDMSELTCRPL